MKNLQTLTGTIENIERFDTSYYGNPRYHFTVEGVEIFTAPNSSHGYGITNYRGKKVNVVYQLKRGKQTLESIEVAV